MHDFLYFDAFGNQEYNRFSNLRSVKSHDCVQGLFAGLSVMMFSLPESRLQLRIAKNHLRDAPSARVVTRMDTPKSD